MKNTKHTPSFGKLLARRMHNSANENFTPYISDGDTARVLCFFNLSGAYDGYAEADSDAAIIAHRVNIHNELLAALNECEMLLSTLGLSPESDISKRTRSILARAESQ
jgi:hypothetical protein